MNRSAFALFARLRNARAFPLLPAALASVPFGFVLVRVREWRNGVIFILAEVIAFECH